MGRLRLKEWCRQGFGMRRRDGGSLAAVSGTALRANARPRLVWAVVLLAVTASVHAQTDGGWRQQAEERIAAHRMAPVRVIVLNGNGQPAAGAAVRIEQLRHDFALGFVVEEPWEEIPWDESPWRCFNAVALDRVAAWPVVQSEREWELDRVESLVRLAHERGMAIRWGGIISADAGRIPAWAADLNGPSLNDAVEAHLNAVLNRFGGRIDEFDVYAHAGSRQLLSPPMVRQLHERAGALAPHSRMCLRFEDALSEHQAQDMIARITDARQAMIPFDAVSVEQRVGGVLLQAPLARALRAMQGLGVDVVVGAVELGGASEAAAASNLETFFRTAFAEPSVTGIYLAGMTAESAVNPHAVLINEFGVLTDVGERLDTLFREVWWTDVQERTDELGNVRTRVFAGAHRVTATLVDGTKIETLAYVHPPSPDRDTRIILLEPVAGAR